jgi:peptidoglycan/xylan/chitin deacetylase (PgdA/CDA1 family)
MRNAIVLALMLVAGAAPGAECGPDKLGTARVLEVGTKGGLQVGLKTYPQTLPLKDHEVILTFDDGPDPDDTPPILAALAEQCVRATFFVIGAKVDAHPDLARRELAEGHTIAHHTYTHPQPTLSLMSAAQARADILRGMITIERVVYGATFPEGEPKDLAGLKLHTPFFRFTGFADTRDLEQWFADNDVATLSTDLWANDWLKMTPEAEMKLIFDRLEKAKRGMLLLHDRVAWTAQMLPRFLFELKKRGYKIVHIVAGPGRGETEAAPAGWVSETGRTIGAIKPRLDPASSPEAPGPFPVKPAPTE